MTSRSRFVNWICPALVTAIASAASTTRAAIISSGDVSPAQPSTWTTSTTAVIGNTATGTLRVTAGSDLLSGSVDLGLTTGAAGSLTVDGIGSTWAYTNLNVGKSGTGVVNIVNGGSISTNSATSYVAANKGSNGTVTVDGAGSSWYSIYGVVIGNSGNGTVNVTNGGQLATNGFDFSDFLGFNAGATGIATVSGAGSIWSSGVWLYVGYSGSGALNILSGGKVSNPSQGYLGYFGGSTGTATVDGPGSTWTNKGVYVGFNGAGILNITNGGNVGSSSASYLGYGAGAPGTATVDGPGSTWTTSGLTVGVAAAATLNITNGGVVIASGTTTLTANGTATAAINFGANGGTLTTQSLLASPAQFTGTGTVNARGLTSDVDLVFDATHGFNQTFLWNSAGQQVTVHLDMTGASGTAGGVGAGYLGHGSLMIRDGLVVTGGGFLGYQKGSSGIATVTGAGSKWTSATLAVGNSGTGMMNITNGGTVTGVSGSDDNIGNNAGASGTVTVDGADSTWITGNNLYVGHAGSAILNITNGSAVTVPNATYLAYNSTATGAINFGANGGTLTTQMLYAAPSELTGTGTINARGLVSDVDLAIDATHGLAQTLTWSKAGQNITVNLDLTGTSGPVGDLGAGRMVAGSLGIRDGLTVTSLDGVLGYGAGSMGTATVDDAGSTWTISKTLYVGYSGAGIVNIAHGGHVISQSVVCAANAAGSTGTLAVDGSGSNWSVGSYMYVGYYGAGTLNITNGGKVSSYICYLANAGATGMATVDGTGSTWTLSGPLYLGDSGTGALAITQGGQVSGSTGYLGYSIRAVGTTVVDGSGSNLNLSDYLYVGNSGSGTLTISNGGRVSNNTYGYLGNNVGATGTASVDGTGSLWTNCTSLYVGYSGTGILNIVNGGTVNNGSANGYYSYLGYNAGSKGTVTADGTGSTWNVTHCLYVGYSGNGTLNITNGGLVTVTGPVCVAYNSTATGLINFGSAGTLSCSSLYAARTQVLGTGVINTRGLVSDFDLVLDATHGLAQPLVWKGPNQDVTINFNFPATGGTGGDLGVGYQGNGTLAIRDGVTLATARGYLGYQSGAAGTVSVSGPGSTWTPYNASLYVGYYGAGILNITNGATVGLYPSGYIGNYPGSTGLVTVDGAGSTWTTMGAIEVGYGGSGMLAITHGGTVSAPNGCSIGYQTGATGILTVDGPGSNLVINSKIFVGYNGTGTLNITNGGQVTAVRAGINATSMLAMTVGDRSLLDLGTDRLESAGILRLKAVPELAAGTYAPIKAGSWYVVATQALGGTWSNTSHTFIVTPAVNATAGQAVSMDLLQTQRAFISDPITGNTVEAGFQPTTSSSNLTFTALPLTPTLTTLLQDTQPIDSFILSAWTLSTTNYTSGTPVFLSLQIGPNLSPHSLSLYHFDGTTWTPFSAPDLSYDGTYANFTVTTLGSYAVTTPTPEPTTLTLLALGTLPLLRRRRRPRRFTSPPRQIPS